MRGKRLEERGSEELLVGIRHHANRVGEIADEAKPNYASMRGHLSWVSRLDRLHREKTGFSGIEHLLKGDQSQAGIMNLDAQRIRRALNNGQLEIYTRSEPLSEEELARVVAMEGVQVFISDTKGNIQKL